MRFKLAACFACALMIGLALGISPPARALSLSSILGGGQPEADNIKQIHVAELVALMHDPKAHVYIYDANLHDVRAQYGIIPGARLLSSAGKYDVANELPADKHAKLVFYCTNLH
jgi:hypothetical protein